MESRLSEIVGVPWSKDRETGWGDGLWTCSIVNRYCGVAYAWQSVNRSIGENVHCLITLIRWFNEWWHSLDIIEDWDRYHKINFSLNALNEIPSSAFPHRQKTHFLCSSCLFNRFEYITDWFLFLHNLLLAHSQSPHRGFVKQSRKSVKYFIFLTLEFA